MADTWLFRLQCLVLIILGIFAYDAGTGDPFVNQPRILIQNGNLVLQSAYNGNVTLVSRGQGSILVNGVDLGKRVLPSIHSAILSPTMTDLIQKVSDQRYKIGDLTDRVNQLEENITAISTKVNRFIGTGQDRISNRALRRVMSKVQALGDKVNTLTQLLTENECNSNPCRNGGACVDTYNGFICNCPSNWEGTTCETDVNECARFAGTSFGCQNGAACINTHGGYSCNCLTNWHGIHCTEKYDDCSTASHHELCGQGTCIDEKRAVPGQPKYRCICDPGWQKSSSSPACTEDIDECNGPNRRCSQNPPVSCINLPGSFHCGHCPAGYTGNGHSCTDMNECETQNGGCSMLPYVQCSNTVGSRVCGPCPAGYVGNGVQCTFLGVCSINRGGCHPLATCIENSAITGTYRECRCPNGYIGSGEGLTGCVAAVGMTCASNPCQHGTCQVVGQSFHCVCNVGYRGTLCDREEIDVCFSSPCLNGGTCIRQTGSFSCVCPEGYEGPNCAVRRSACGGYLVGDNGTLQFPETGIHYDHLKDCAWDIIVSPSKVVNITFNHFSLEAGVNCEFDFLQLNDGPTAASRVIGSFCNVDLHGWSFVSTHNELYFWFHSDKTVASTGFSIDWTAVDPVCGGELNISDYGAINSPGYPGVYPKNRTCSWLVRVPVGKRIQFHFATLKMENHPNCSYDYLKIFDGATDRDPLIGTYCTTITPPPLTTSGHSALLFFNSDDTVQDTGFHITYSSQSNVQGCGGVLTNPIGTIRSPNYPDVYENNLNCEWLIRIHPENRLLLSFSEFHLETHANCAFDYVEVYAGATDADPLLGRYCGSTIPQELFSNTNQLYIRFRTDNSLVHSGFKAEYRTICGGVYTEPTGLLSSPYYPENYPARAQCIYDIRLEQGYLINVTFHNMEIEEHIDCRFDYLQVRDGDSDTSPIIGQLCGNEIPENIVSTYNYLWMKFETDGIVQNRGFYAQYEAIEVGCGGVLTELRGQIFSPRHPDRYPHSIICSWYLKAPEGHVVRLTFTSFYLEPDKECRFDYVVVEDNSGNQIGRFCGNERPPILTSMDNSLFVKFIADSSVARDGFTANYEFLNGMDACGGTFYQESGVIRSPGFPDRYPHNSHCIWILKGRNQRQITLNATFFHLEQHVNCKYDFLEIRNGGFETSPLIGKYCGTEILSPLKSHSNNLRIEFRTDGSMSAPGFEIYFDSTATGCGGKLTSPRGTIISPNYPQAYPYNADCEWLIQVSQGSLITVSIIDVDIEEHRECRYDYVQVFDGNSENSKSILRICNNQQNPGTITSTGSSLLIRFRSDFSEEAGGFHFVYHTQCNNELTKRRGVIESPNFPNTYPHNQNCSWTIEAPNGNNISLSFSHLFLEGGESCDADYVEVLEVDQSDGQVQIGKYCGSLSQPPNALETKTNKVIVRLVTDRTVTLEGFRLEWTMKGCGGDIVNKPFGNITSPNYPNGYQHQTTCYWHISYPPGNQVELTITDLDLEAGYNCGYDYVRVFGGEDEQSPRLLNSCHIVEKSQVVTSHGNHMMVKFNSDINIGGRGFKANFKKITGGCGGLFTAPESVLMSPNFPSPYNANDDCYWLIQVDQTQLVVLDFYDFEIPEATNCTMGYLEIYDGNSSSSPVLLKHCGGKPEGSISSTGNQMLVRLVGDGNNVGKGFRAHYHTGCGQRLLADNGGEITSPNYPYSLTTSSNCSWIIYASEPGEKVSLTVTYMHIFDLSNCTYHSLILMDGDTTDSPIIGEYCGQRSPPRIVTRGSILHVFLKNWGIFRATYGLASIHCGGSFKTLRGTFGSPGYPDNYDRDTECVWTVEASAGNKVHLNFEAFNLEDSDHCNTDYLEIHENDATGRLIGRYCGNRIPSNVTAAQKLWIKFRSDEISTQAGFLAHYELQHGNVLNGTEGEIASPGYPLKYSFGEEMYYIWTVFVPSGMFISVRFLEIGIVKMQESNTCSFSKLEVHDGLDSDAPLLGEFCGFQIPEPVVSTGNVIFLKYFNTQHYLGSFLLQWVAVTESGIVLQNPEPATGDICWEEITLNATESITVNSPNYPQNYPNEINCTYIIRTPHYQHVEINITNLEMEDWPPSCNFDRLEVHYMLNPNVDEWRLNSTMCGRMNSTFLTSPTNMMKLVFSTDKFVNFKGFNSIASSRCGAHFTGSSGVLKSDYIYPDLIQRDRYAKLQCEYFITVKSRRTIQLTFDKFNVPSDGICSTNYILLRNGGTNSSPLLGKFCGSSAPNMMETSSNEVYVQVVVDSISAGSPNFELRYTEVSVGCGGHLFVNDDNRYVEITSPNYPNPPVHDTECEWTIVSPSGTRMRIDFDSEFHMGPNCNEDEGENIEYLEIYDGGTEMAPQLHRFCGNDQPSSLMSTGNAFYVKYVTAVDNPQPGFKSKIGIAECGGTISSFSEVIKSPNYPNTYGNSQECEWFLKMPMGYSIILNLTDINTPRPLLGANCTSTDFLEIRDFNAEGELLGIFCGTLKSSRIINVPGSQVYVKFKSNSGITGKGFSMKMEGNFDDGCGGWVEGSAGVITSPNYPNPVTSPRHCNWRILAPEGRKVRVSFREFNLPRDESTGICLSYLRATNGTYWRRSTSVNDLCGSTLPASLSSSSGYMNILFFTSALNAGQGFTLIYTTEEESICGGLLSLPTGVIATPPNITVQEETFMECRWKISGDQEVNQTVVLRFDVLDVPGIMANYCRNGVLYVVGGRTYLGRYCGNYPSEVIITSPYPTTEIRFIALLNTPIRGVHGTYNVSNCGGVLSGDVEIFSPGYPASYPPNTDCHWIINAEEGETLTLSILDLRMEDNCDKDYVYIRNGMNFHSPLLGKFCGNHIPAPITSSSNVLTVIFHSDAYGTAPGFKISTVETQRGCGGLIHMERGNITSPKYPAHYEINVECRWIIEYVPGSVVKVEFVGRFDLEMDNNCEKDYLLFEEYEEDDTWSVISKKCGQVTPNAITSKSRKMRITFHSNERITGDGFSLKYSTACGGNFTKLSGEIFSPNYPNFYGNYLNCVYTIGKHHQYVSLTFDDYFSLEGNADCIYDYVMISYSNSTNTTEQGPYCGDEVPAARTLQGPVTLKFVTDDTYTAHGFRVKYEILDCGATLTDATGVIATPKTSEEYLNEMDCTWQILAPSDRVIALRFSLFDIEMNYRCWQDYLEIRDGLDNGPLIGKICGNSTPVVKSTGNVLTLKLHMSSGKPGKGFNSYYHTTYGVNQGCGGTLNVTSGEVQSLDADSDGLYEPNLDCSWLIVVDNNDQVIQVTFDRFDIESSPNGTCVYDYLELREDINLDSSLIGRYCGSVLPSTIITSGNRLNIIFHSDNQINKAGFKLRFVAIYSPCGYSTLITRPDVTQTVTSPNYPSPYPVNLRCRWTISRNTSKNDWPREMVQLTFTELDVPCDGDYVEVQKVRPNGAFQRHIYPKQHRNGYPTRLCGPLHAHDIIAHSGMTLTFHSDSNINGARGFSVNYKDAICNRTYTDDSGVLLNSGYPGRFNSDKKCVMTITSSPGKTISLYFSRLEMYDAEANCAVNNLKIFDGLNNSAPVIGTYCGFDAPNPVFSTGHSLHLESFMEQKMGSFYMIYMTTDQGKGCGGSIYAEEGSISSPLYPQTYKRDTECVWYLTVPGYHSMKLEFKSLVLNSTAGCESNYVEIYDGSSGEGSERVARYCGSDSPGVHISRTNEMVVKFKSDSTNYGPGFLLNFESNTFLSDTSLSLIQRHPEVQSENPNSNIIYLT